MLWPHINHTITGSVILYKSFCTSGTVKDLLTTSPKENTLASRNRSNTDNAYSDVINIKYNQLQLNSLFLEFLQAFHSDSGNCTTANGKMSVK